MLVRIISWLLFSILNITCFNIDVDFPVVYKDPSRISHRRSYFGYSVVMYSGGEDGSQKWIRIGAPRAVNTDDLDDLTTGAVYNCLINSGYEVCRNMQFPRAPFKAFVTEIKNDSWIGGTMDINYKHNIMAVCAPRRHFKQITFQIYGVISTDHRTIGGCYWSRLNTTVFEDIEALREKFLSIGVITTKDYSLYYYGQGQAGFSLHFPPDDNEFIIGSPGAYDWSGTVVNLKNEIDQSPIPNRRRRREISGLAVNVARQDYDVSDQAELFGYSVTSGYFYGGNSLYYAAGGPKGLKGDKYKGKVLTFKFNGELSLLRREVKKGKQLGEYFGSSLAAGKVNNDIYDDIIVGAPFYKDRSYNEGRVILYLGGENNLTKSTELKGTSANGQFGSAIMYLGDIDNDGFGDVAISAPYANEFGGVVYIYRGQDNGLHTEPCQTISGKEILPDIRGFGVSISRSTDMDGNGYNDVAIGAPLSGHVVYLRSRPIVTLHCEFRSIPSILETTEDNFTLKACFSFSGLKQDNISISFQIRLNELNNIHTMNNFTVSRLAETCSGIDISLKDTLFNQTSLTAVLSYSIPQPPSQKKLTIISDRVEQLKDNFCKSCPILNTFNSSRNNSELRIPIVFDCGDDHNCQSRLQVRASILELGHSKIFVVGSASYLTLQTTVENTGENAYNANIEISFSDAIQFVNVLDKKCKLSANRSAVSCQLDNPLKKKSAKQLSFDLDMRNINSGYIGNDVIMTFKTSTISNDTNPSNIYKYSLELQQADIGIFGFSEQGNYFFGNNSGGMVKMTHIYKVYKTGRTPLDQLLVKINIPYSFNNSNSSFLGVFQPVTRFKGNSMKCFGNFDYISEEKVVGHSSNIDLASIFPSQKKSSQLKSLTSNEVTENGTEIYYDNTFFLNCSTKLVECFELKCSFGPFDDSKDVAEIKLDMLVFTSNLKDLLAPYDILVVSSNADVIITFPEDFEQTGSNPEHATVSTSFKKIELVYVSLWVIIISILSGLLLLTLIVITLFKLGFFNRSVKAELESIKAEASVSEQGCTDELEDPTQATEMKIINNRNVQNEKDDDDDDDGGGKQEETDTTLQQNFNSSSREGLIDISNDEK